MKKLLFGLAAIGLAFNLTAATPTYKTMVGAAPAGGTTNQVIFPADATTQIRLVSLAYATDTNIAILSFYTCGPAYVVTATNANAALTVGLNTTNGLAADDTLVWQKAGVCYLSTVSVIASNTNCVFTAPLAKIAAGDEAYKLDVANAATVAVGSNSYGLLAGEAVYVGNPGRPVLIKVSPCHVTNKITSATARYE